MKSERLVILLSPEEKARIQKLARRRQASVGELVRSALARLDEPKLDRRGRSRLSVGARGKDEQMEETNALDVAVGDHGPPGKRSDTEFGTEDDQDGGEPATGLSAEQVAALEQLADRAMRTMARANAALDKAFEEIDATKAYFAERQRVSGGSA
jgi:hypothetical protein